MDMKIYRVQPIGLTLDGVSETSSGDLDCGRHVFLSLRELADGVDGWMPDHARPEILAIDCEDEDLVDNEDFEGMTLLEGCGAITARRAWADWGELHAWAATVVRHGVNPDDLSGWVAEA